MPFRFAPSSWHFNIDNYVNPWLPPPPFKYLPAPIARFFGHRKEHQQPLGNIVMVFWAFLGVFCSILVIEVVGHQIPSFADHGAPIIVGSFGAAAVLEFYAIDSPLAQPRNAILGQIFASVIGIVINKLFELGPQSHHLIWVAGSLSCASAVAVMALTGTIHPPAGATALLAVVDRHIAQLGWFLLPVVVLGCVLMQCVALLLNNIQRRFPNYWWTPEEVGQKWRRPREKEAGDSDTDVEHGAKFERVSTHHPPTRDELKIVITRGRVHVPDDLNITPEGRMFLEQLSEQI
ncbi:hypothetical protein DL764_009105 [Monosporascus ibericus]|uniref:HPP transmembrane region domain-containing protein n=1 Tax=Monosporascus ibericus TaxID=155417 RepID=A0A4Q4SYS7_9PEZI|nr:hypothetical protein DL764_009105 [Monosporascus ibericus]